MEIYHLSENTCPKTSRFYVIKINKTKMSASQVLELFMAYAECLKKTSVKEYNEECVLFEYNVFCRINFRNKIEKVSYQDNQEKPFVELIIISKNNTSKKETQVLNFKRTDIVDFQTELQKIRSEKIRSEKIIDTDKTERTDRAENNTEQSEVRSDKTKEIIKMSDDLIRKWRASRNSLTMSLDMLKLETLANESNIDKKTHNDYINPLYSLVNHMKKENYDEIKDNILVKCIVNKDIDNLLIHINETNANATINTMDTTLLMLANINSIYHIRIVEILILFNANKNAIDKNGFSYVDYAEKGNFLFSFE